MNKREKAIEEERSKNQKKLVQITLDEKSLEKENQEILKDLKEDYNRNVQNMGQRPGPKEQKATKRNTLLEKEVVVGYDYTASDRWEKIRKL